MVKGVERAARDNDWCERVAARRIDALRTNERETKALEADQRQRVRNVQARPQLASLHAWAEALVRQTLPSGKLGEALGWYYHLEHQPRVPFDAACITRRSTSPLQVSESVTITGLAPEDGCGAAIIVLDRWYERPLGVPPSQLTPLQKEAQAEA